jgi:hypothetical protein
MSQAFYGSVLPRLNPIVAAALDSVLAAARHD